MWPAVSQQTAYRRRKGSPPNVDNSLLDIGSTAVKNDKDGNVLCINGSCPSGVGSFAWDPRGHLAQIIYEDQGGSFIGSDYYTYDAFGRRINVISVVETAAISTGYYPPIVGVITVAQISDGRPAAGLVGD